MRHQVNESPIVLQAFLFLHILAIIYLCLSIVLKRVRLDPRPWHLCLRALERTCAAFARACLVLLRAAWAVSSTSRSFGKKMGFGMLWPLAAANLKIYPARQKTLVHHYNILPTSTTCSACFVTSRSPGALLERF